MMRGWGLAVGIALGTLAGGCKPAPTVRPPPKPAPASTLARELGADDAGRGWLEIGECPAARATRVDTKRPLGAPSRRGSPNLMDPAAPSDVGFFATLTTPPEPFAEATERKEVRLLLAAPQTAAPHEPIPLRLAAYNAGEDAVVLTRARDGSFEHMRAPFVDVVAKDLATGSTYRFAPGADYGRCGNVNPISGDDFVTLTPGHREDDLFGDWSRRSLDVVIGAPGTYTLWVVYTACVWPTSGLALGPDDPTPPSAFEGTIVSSPVVVTIR